MRTNGQIKNAEEVILTDTGPIVALVDKSDEHREQAMSAIKHLPKVPLLTTWPCSTKAMNLLCQVMGYSDQEILWRFIERGSLQLYLPSEDDWRRMRELMATYQDAPMDMADASLIAATEALSLTRIFTYDRHFYAYRLANGDTLEIVQ